MVGEKRASRARSKKGTSKKGSIWDRPHIQKILEEPVGTPIHLTREEWIEIAREAAGSRPDLPDGREYVKRVRPITSAALLRRNG